MDNAPMASFFHTLRVELVQQRLWATQDEAKHDVFAYIEGYDNQQRVRSSPGYQMSEQMKHHAS
jgi:transposase InsO family protein